MTKKKKKKFDCVEMKRKGAAAIYKKIKNMSMEEELAFWKKEDEKFKIAQEKYKSSSLKKAS